MTAIRIGLIAGLLLLLQAQCFGREEDQVADLILQRDVRVSDSVREANRDWPIIILVDIHGGQNQDLFNEQYILELARNKFEHFGREAKAYTGDFARDFQKGKLGTKALLSPKLVVSIETSQNGADSGYAVSSSLSLIEYSPVETSSHVFRAKREWYSRQEIRGISRREIEDNLSRFIQTELGTLLKNKIRPKVAKRSQEKENSGGGSGNSSGALSYSLNWHDPDPKRNHFIFGASVGTPALFNLHLGYWGSNAVPVVVGISGMYFDLGHRGIQGDVGWAIDNRGDFRQVVGATVFATNESAVNTTTSQDEFGRTIQINTETINRLVPYVGPSYIADWKSFRLQGGVGFRADGDMGPAMRVIFQLGYTPPISF